MTNIKKGTLLSAFRFAGAGIWYCLRKERNFQIQSAVALVVLVMGWILKLSTGEWLAIGICIAAVLFAEMINTALEALCDRVQPEIDPAIKKVKDISAGAVLLISIVAAVCGLIVFVPKLIDTLL